MRKYNHKISERANESLRKREAIVRRQRGLLAVAIIVVVALGILLGTIPSILLSIYTTQEQKKASRIANMLATKNLNNINQNIEKESKQKSCINAYNDFIKISN